MCMRCNGHAECRGEACNGVPLPRLHVPRRVYAECKARELQRTRAEAEEAESQLMKLAKDIQHKVRHLAGAMLSQAVGFWLVLH